MILAGFESAITRALIDTRNS